MRGIAVLATITAFSLCLVPARADTDVVGFLNSKLAAKGIKVNRTRSGVRNAIQCHYEGLNGRPHRWCDEVEVPYTEQYTDQARVTNAQFISILPLQWDEAKITTIPATALIERLTYTNCGADPFSTTVSLQVKGTHANSVQKMHSLSIKTSVGLKNTFKMGNGILGGQTEVSIGIDVTTSDSTTNTEQFSNEETRTWGATISPAVGHGGYLQLLAIQQSIEVPFSTTVVVDGNMEPNVSGISKVSQILSESERTLPFDGTVKASQLSDSYAGNYLPDTPLNCNSPAFKDKQLMTKTDFTVPLSSLDKSYTASYTTIEKAFSTRISAAVDKLTTTRPPDDITGQTIYSTDVLVGDAQCGFDPHGAPKPARHLAELGHYTKFEKGILQAQWDEWSDVFKSCLPQ